MALLSVSCELCSNVAVIRRGSCFRLTRIGRKSAVTRRPTNCNAIQPETRRLYGTEGGDLAALRKSRLSAHHYHRENEVKITTRIGFTNN